MKNSRERDTILQQVEQEIYLKQLQYERQYSVSENEKKILFEALELLLEVNSGLLCEGGIEDICIDPKCEYTSINMIADSFDVPQVLIKQFAQLLKKVRSFSIEAADEEWLRIVVCLNSIWKDE